MTAFELLEALGGIEEKYLSERYDAKQERMKLIRTFTAAAASVVLISGIGIGIALTGWRTGSSAESAGEFEKFGITETNAAAVTEDACEPEAGNTTAMDGADLPEL
ncbi:MAG: hypothetical protein IJY35_00835, partial [Clostridia bacterium]|nr:hypothetical protein [Clostridia bacterium]